MSVSAPVRVSTCAFVNLVMAVFLGWVLGGEAVTFTTILAAATIIAGVAVITLSHTQALQIELEAHVDAETVRRERGTEQYRN